MSLPLKMADKLKAQKILRKIVPWAIEANSSILQYRDNHKGSRGRIGVVGGSRDFAGAPYFAAISAMRLGFDLAYVICSETTSQAIKSYSPDLIVVPLLDHPSEDTFFFSVESILDRIHTLVIGPGLGTDKLAQSKAKFLIELAKTRSLPIVMDADAITLCSDDITMFESYPNVLITPNSNELQRLWKYTGHFGEVSRREVVKSCSTDLGVTILAKGPVDIISSAANTRSSLDLETEELSGSNRRCGGQGDILSGLAGAYLHWILESNRLEINLNEKIEHPTVWAGYLAATTTRKCNEIAFKEYKSGMLTSHMIDKVQDALQSLLNEESTDCNQEVKNAKYTTSLGQDEIKRYSRQMIMEEFGPERQLKLKKTSVLIIGAGGLGCPAAVYLGGGGIGRIGIVDDDQVEISNLHRQILHKSDGVGMLKTDSIKQAIAAINPNVEVVCHSVRMTKANAVDIIEKYDIVLDATDNLLTRYMISDACVVAKKPLVSGAALKMDGQLTVYNYNEETPCFRCLFPDPPPAGAVGSCSDNGVLGVIPGIIGVHQALEAMKIGAGLRPAYAGTMLLFDGQLGHFRHITLGKRKSNCKACGSASKLDRNLFNYQVLCDSGVAAQRSDILSADERITVEQYRDILNVNIAHVLVDVRPLSHSKISRFSHAITIPMTKLLEDDEESLNLIKSELKSKKTNQIYVICRRGIASQRGTKVLKELFKNQNVVVKDVIGGMSGWASHIDPSYSCV